MPAGRPESYCYAFHQSRTGFRELSGAPICLVQYDDLVSSWGKRDLLLCELLDLVADDVDPSIFLLSLKNVCAAALFTHLSSDAFSSNTPSLYASPSSWCARQCMLVVFPIPGIPCRRSEVVKRQLKGMTIRDALI